MVRILVHDRRMVLELAVDGGDGPAQRRDQLGHGADGLELAERLALLDLVANVRKLDRDHLSELLLPVVGDAELRAIPLDAKPEVIFGELENLCHWRAPSPWWDGGLGRFCRPL